MKKRGGFDNDTLLGMLPPDEAREIRGGGERKGGYALNPNMVLEPAYRNPNVRRWHRKGAALEGDEEDSAWVSNLYGDPHLGRAILASSLLEEIASESKYRDTVREWAKTKIRVVKGFWRNLFLPTPRYFPDENEIVIGKKHLSDRYAKRYGASGAGIVLVHELAHAWDFAAAKARGHDQKSFWISEIMPKIVEATNGKAPNWADMPGMERFKYGVLEAAEMPAILTEYMLTKPEHYEAIDRWFRKKHNISIKDAMAEFWGTDVFNYIYYDEDETTKLLAKMDSFRPGDKKQTWKSRITHEVSYAGTGAGRRAQHAPDPGFVDLSVLERRVADSTELSPENGEGGEEENG